MDKVDKQTEDVRGFLTAFANNEIPLIKQLIAIRKLFKKSQGEISREMGVTPSAICIVESGKRKGTLETIQRYADALNLRVVLAPKELK